MKKAIVIYETRYGNTERIALALSGGLKSGGIPTDCVKVQEIDVAQLDQYDFLAIGGPTHGRGISDKIKKFLKEIEKINLQGKKAFAFDTRFRHKIYSSAAKKIQEKLEEMHLEIVENYSSAVVKGWYGPLEEEDSEERFRQIGFEIAKIILS